MCVESEVDDDERCAEESGCCSDGESLDAPDSCLCPWLWQHHHEHDEAAGTQDPKGDGDWEAHRSILSAIAGICLTGCPRVVPGYIPLSDRSLV